MSSHSMRERNRNRIDSPQSFEYPRVGRRKDEDEDIELWEILPTCRLCWVHFTHGKPDCACECLSKLLQMDADGS